MNNLDALKRIHEVIDTFLASVGTVPDAEIDRRLRTQFSVWEAVEDLEGIAVIVARAWVELTPDNEIAKRCLLDLLTDLDRLDERQGVVDGQPLVCPDPSDEANLKRLGERLLSRVTRAF